MSGDLSRLRKLAVEVMEYDALADAVHRAYPFTGRG